MIGNATKGARTIRNAASTDSTPAMASMGTTRSAGMSGARSLYSFPVAHSIT